MNAKSRLDRFIHSLQLAGERLRQRADDQVRVLKDLLQRLVELLKIVAEWTARIVKEVGLAILKMGWHLLKLAAVFLFLLYLASFGFELTNATSSSSSMLSLPLKVFGWIILLSSLLFLFVSIWALLPRSFPTDSKTGDAQPFPRSYAHLLFLFLDIVLLLIIGTLTIHSNYQFRAIPLSKTQELMRPPIRAVLPAIARTLDAILPRDRTTLPLHKITDKLPAQTFEHWLPFQSLAVHVRNTEERLSLWVENIRVTRDETIFRLACKTWGSDDVGQLRSASGAYFTDDQGQRYDLKDDRGDYTLFSRTHEIKATEIYKYDIAFPTLAHNTVFITLKLPQFEDIRVTLNISATP